MVHVIPLEMANYIWNYSDINTKLMLNRAFGVRTFYTTSRTNVALKMPFQKQLIGMLRIRYFRYIVMKQMHILNANTTFSLNPNTTLSLNENTTF